MPFDPTESWAPYLGPGETLLWTGAPERDTRLRWRHIAMALFGLPFLLFGLVLFGATVLGTLRGGGETLEQWGLGLLAYTVSLSFIAAGVYMVIWQHLSGRLQHRYVRYALGTQRAYIATRWWRQSVTSYAIGPYASVELMRDGLDTVVFQVGITRDSDGDTQTLWARFSGLRDGTEPYQLIRKLQSGTAD